MTIYLLIQCFIWFNVIDYMESKHAIVFSAIMFLWSVYFTIPELLEMF